MADTPVIEKRGPIANEIGVSGLKVFSGYVQEEYQKELTGARGQRILRRMGTSDPVIKAVLRAIGLVLRGVKWRIEPADAGGTKANDEAAFVESLFDDMSHTWEDFLSEVLGMLVYGWAYHEIVLKLRVGPTIDNPAKRSKFTDNRIGIRKLAPRAQDTLMKWEMQADGGIDGMWQQPITGGMFFIPIDNALLFRTESRKNNPEGESLIRSAYDSWYAATNIRNYECIGIERELAGLPVVSIPASYLAANATPDEKAMLAKYTKIARDLKFNEQGGIVIPSDTFRDTDGKMTDVPLVSVKLITSGGTRAIDTSAVIQRHQRDMARSVLADFVMLGSDSKGSFALSKDKTDFFLRACEAILDQIEAPINRYLLPRVWDYNGLDRALLPTLKHEPVAQIDLATLGAYLRDLNAAGAPLFPDDGLSEFVREAGDLPPPDPNAMSAGELAMAQIDAKNKAGIEDDPNKPAPGDGGEQPPGGTNKPKPSLDKPPVQKFASTRPRVMNADWMR